MPNPMLLVNGLSILEIQRMKALLKSTGHPDFGTTSNLNRLIEVFRSWWLIRLPGPLLVVATGEQPGPAADLISTCAMYGKLPPGISLPEPKPQQPTSYQDVDAGIKKALDSINAVLYEAEGEGTGKSTHTRIQRRRLAELLTARMSMFEKRSTVFCSVCLGVPPARHGKR